MGRGVTTFAHARHLIDARRTDETSRSESWRSRILAIPYAVQSGFRYPAFAFLPGLRYRPLGAKLFELCSGRFGQRGISHIGPIP
jgi:hypothetical protein